MKVIDLVSLVTLAAIWGGSFLFMRIAGLEFGAVAMVALRVLIAAIFLLPILLWRSRGAGLKQLSIHFWPLCVTGLLNTAVPFVLLAYATLVISAGYAAILNSTAPLFSGLIAYLWYQERLTISKLCGFLIGLFGVVVLVWSKLMTETGDIIIAIALGLFAAFCYGIAANYVKRHLQQQSTLLVATGSQVTASLMLIPWLHWFMPNTEISASAWLSVLILGVMCTSLAYLIYFSMIKRLGPTPSISVTFLVPVFGVLWGVLFLNELVTLNMLIGGGIILLGTAMGLGLIGFSFLAKPSQSL